MRRQDLALMLRSLFHPRTTAPYFRNIKYVREVCGGMMHSAWLRFENHPFVPPSTWLLVLVFSPSSCVEKLFLLVRNVRVENNLLVSDIIPEHIHKGLLKRCMIIFSSSSTLVKSTAAGFSLPYCLSCGICVFPIIPLSKGQICRSTLVQY